MQADCSCKKFDIKRSAGNSPSHWVRNNNGVLRPMLIACMCLVYPCSTLAQDAAQTDADLLGKTLKESGIANTDIGKFYQVKYRFSESKRTQLAFLRKRVETYRGLSVQEAFSLVYESKTAPSSDVMSTVFQKSYTIGGFILEEPGEDQEFWRIRFRIEVPTNSTPERLKTLLSLTAGTADQIEQQLGGEDRL